MKHTKIRLISLVITSIFLWLTFNSNAQVYYGIGVSYTPSYKIDQILKDNNLPTTQSFLLTADVYNRNIELGSKFLQFAFQLSGNTHIQHGIRNSLINVNGEATYGHTVLNQENIKFKTGALIGFGGYNLLLYDDNTTMDLSHINLKTATGMTSFYMIPVNIGLSARADFFSQSFYAFALDLSYHHIINSPQWKSSYGTSINSIKENGGYFNLKLLFPMGG